MVFMFSRDLVGCSVRVPESLTLESGWDVAAQRSEVTVLLSSGGRSLESGLPSFLTGTVSPGTWYLRTPLYCIHL